MSDTPIAILQGDKRYYIYPDQQNSPRAIADQTGTSLGAGLTFIAAGG